MGVGGGEWQLQVKSPFFIITIFVESGQSKP
jgi:hypothetical protein